MKYGVDVKAFIYWRSWKIILFSIKKNLLQIEFYGHEHLYERSYPIYDYHVYNISSPHLYTNAKAPIHIISGAAVSYFHWNISKNFSIHKELNL